MLKNRFTVCTCVWAGVFGWEGGWVGMCVGVCANPWMGMEVVDYTHACLRALTTCVVLTYVYTHAYSYFDRSACWRMRVSGMPPESTQGVARMVMEMALVVVVAATAAVVVVLVGTSMRSLMALTMMQNSIGALKILTDVSRWVRTFVRVCA